MTKEEAEAIVRAALPTINGALFEAYKAGHKVEIVTVSDDKTGPMYMLRSDIDRILKEWRK